MPFFNVCSNPKCDYSEPFDPEKKDRQHLCPKCGAGIWYTCPHCKERTFNMQNLKFCPQCRKEIKPPPSPPGRKRK